MIKALVDFLNWYRRRRHVRPWAMIVPVLVLLFCLPLLKPIRHPDPRGMGDEESAIFATVQSLVEHRSLAIDRTAFIGTRHKIRIGPHYYSQSPPVFPLLLSGGYELLHRSGLTFESNPTLVMYLLTLLGVTLPVAAASGLIYRMGRLFELSRPWRALLTFVVAFASGWVSYATFLNPYAPAAALVLSAAACLIHVALLPQQRRAIGWLVLTGLCVALAAVIDCGAAMFIFLFAAIIPSMRWSWQLRVLGLIAFLVGIIIPVAAHIALTQPVFGDWRPILVSQASVNVVDPAVDLEFDEPPGVGSRTGQIVGQVFSALLGRHGLFTHFPILVIGLIGVSMVMHRHWPSYAKMLAGSAIAGILGIIGLYVSINADWHGGMFANRSLLVCMPIALFWSGVWLRREHSRGGWICAGVLLLFSCLVTAVGAVNPSPKQGYDQYTAWGAVRMLTNSDKPIDSRSLAVRR